MNVALISQSHKFGTFLNMWKFTCHDRPTPSEPNRRRLQFTERYLYGPPPQPGRRALCGIPSLGDAWFGAPGNLSAGRARAARLRPSPRRRRRRRQRLRWDDVDDGLWTTRPIGRTERRGRRQRNASDIRPTSRQTGTTPTDSRGLDIDNKSTRDCRTATSAKQMSTSLPSSVVEK